MIRPIPTRRPLLARLWTALGEACDTHPWLPMAIALSAAVLVNTTY